MSTTEIFFVPLENVSELAKKFEAFENKAKKLGLGAVSYEVGRKEVKELSFIDRTGDTTVFRARRVLCQEVIVTSEPIHILGWTPAFSLEHLEGGTLVKAFPGVEVKVGEVEKYNKYLGNCGHCGFNRKRNDTVILRNAEQEIQVGLSCVRDYLGIDPNHIAAMAEGLKDIRDMMNDGWGMSRGTAIELFIATCIEVSERFGYVSKKKATETGECTTASRATDVLLDKDPRDESIEKANKALEWVRALTAKSDYEINLQTICKGNTYQWHHSNFLASLWPAYLMNTQERIEKVVPTSVWVGKVGDKIERKATFIRENSFSTQFGVTKILTFRDEEGNVLTWFTTTYPTLQENDKVTIKGTIKELTEYKGLKQTVLTRCKIS